MQTKSIDAANLSISGDNVAYISVGGFGETSISDR